jgi:hypothetical protein
MRDVYQHAWGGEKYIKNVIGKSERKIPVGRSGHRWRTNNKTKLER